MTVRGCGADPAANLVTILVGRHEIARFIAHMWAHAPGHESDRHDLRVALERDGQRLAITLEHEGFGSEGPSPQAVRGMTALLEALAEPDQDDSRAAR